MIIRLYELIKDVHKGRPQDLTVLTPASAYLGLLQAKCNSNVRIWQTPPSFCGADVLYG